MTSVIYGPQTDPRDALCHVHRTVRRRRKVYARRNKMMTVQWHSKVSGALVQSFDSGPPSISNQKKI